MRIGASRAGGPSIPCETISRMRGPCHTLRRPIPKTARPCTTGAIPTGGANRHQPVLERRMKVGEVVVTAEDAVRDAQALAAILPAPFGADLSVQCPPDHCDPLT